MCLASGIEWHNRKQENRDEKKKKKIESSGGSTPFLNRMYVWINGIKKKSIDATL